MQPQPGSRRKARREASGCSPDCTIVARRRSDGNFTARSCNPGAPAQSRIYAWPTAKLQSGATILLLDQLPNPGWRERQLPRLDLEGGKRGSDRIGNHAADRNDAALAGPFGA